MDWHSGRYSVNTQNFLLKMGIKSELHDDKAAEGMLEYEVILTFLGSKGRRQGVWLCPGSVTVRIGMYQGIIHVTSEPQQFRSPQTVHLRRKVSHSTFSPCSRPIKKLFSQAMSPADASDKTGIRLPDPLSSGQSSWLALLSWLPQV